MEVRGWWDDERIELAVASNELEGGRPNRDMIRGIGTGVPGLKKMIMLSNLIYNLISDYSDALDEEGDVPGMRLTHLSGAAAGGLTHQSPSHRSNCNKVNPPFPRLQMHLS
jgi:hypothetical protein